MKRTVLWAIAFLLVGFALGTLYTSQLNQTGTGTTALHTVVLPTTVPLPTSGSANAGMVTANASSAVQAFDRADNAQLLRQATVVLDAVKSNDYATLSAMVHPEKGVTFTPYSTVDAEHDLCFTTTQMAAAERDTNTYIWGTTTGKTPITLSIQDYFAQYVFNSDYTQASQVGIDMLLGTGNALENVSAAYPGGRFVEFYSPGTSSAKSGYDWSSLKLVFEAKDNTWYLVGMIHSEWTT
ncbi:MAG: hypothetical protein LUG13_05305 [Oscillospiraceae bacterium]|nr:hypothetical protein [Oscillospiraceae bacterium]